MKKPMRPMLFVSAAFAAAALTPLTGCVTDAPRGGAPMPLVDGSGRTIGSVRAWQTSGGVSFRLDATGLPHGVHGIHVHTIGRCVGPDFASAGAHWNPGVRKHGLNNPAGPHAGDMPNIAVSANGVLAATVTLAGARPNGPGPAGVLLDYDGASIVIHAGADDNMTDPSGNSGARIACAVIEPNAELR